ncbi:uncharacterized protein [Argopecten irradians]|uniref:uncharacterized protein n=1 Tax=Argopecten irradians TaxID=31199 RepID=UPI0037151BD5
MALATYKEENLCCPICTEELKEPKSLPCCHGFCKSCLHSYIMSRTITHERRMKGFKCPICRAFTAAPDQKSSRQRWAEDFLTDHRFVSMLDSLPKDPESIDSASTNCTCHQGQLSVLCQTHTREICETCAVYKHSKCSVVTKGLLKSQFDETLNKLQVLQKSLEQVKLDLERCEGNTDGALSKRSLLRNYKIKDEKSIRNIRTMIGQIVESHRINLEKRKTDFQMAIDDTRSQVTLATTLGSQQSINQLSTSVEVLQVTLEELQERHRRLTRLPNTLSDIKRRTQAYVACAVSSFKLKDSSAEVERKGGDIPYYFGLRMSESFDAKLPSDSKNCLITGATILTDGRIVLVDSNNNSIKMFSSRFVFVNCIDLLAPPFDVVETECNSIAVTFGKRNVIHLYAIRDKVPHEHTFVSTDQPCYGLSSGNALLYVYCGNSWLNPACIKIYDYQLIFVTKIFTKLFSFGEYLGYCPVSEHLYATSTDVFLRQQLHCYQGDGECQTLDGFCYRDTLGWTSVGLVHGLVGVRYGVIMVVRNARRPFGSLFSRSVVVYEDHRSVVNNVFQAKLLLGSGDALFARTVASNKQRTMLLITQEAPIFMNKRNNQVKIYRIVGQY